MTQNELNEILAAHIAWLEGKPEGRKANIQDAELPEANFQDYDLRKADFRRAYLWSANFQGNDLREVNFQGADIREVNFNRCNLWRSNLQNIDLRDSSFRWAILKEANLQRSNLQGVDLWKAELQGADIRGANIDYSSWPLWCGSLDVKVDARIAAQLAYHFCRLDCNDPDYIAARNAILDFANTFHRVMECGKLIKK